jgi:tRNA threonylcarbamoyl adenosine modification protein YjeE
MQALGLRIGRTLRAGDLLVLTGPLGAGKTTLTRGLGEGLEVRGPVTSPTFVIARTHPSLVDGPPLVHVDAYRVGSAMELDDLDIDYARSVVVAEWGEGLLDGVAPSWLDVRISRPTGAGAETAGEADDGIVDDRDLADEPVEERSVVITAHGPRWSGSDLAGIRSDGLVN